MAYVNVINKQDDNNVLSGFGTVIINTDAIEADKELLVPYGYELDSEIALKVAFINGHNCVDASTPLTVKIKYADGSYIEESGNPKEIAVKVNQYGTLVNLPIHNISSTYKCLDPNTVLEMYYNGTDFVVIGNPTVLASDNYEIKANGKNTALEAHPIHSLYWSSDSTSPNILFGGGTWVQIKDRFILSAGDTYANGATGGEATVALTVAEMPTHNHGGSTGNGGVDHTHGMDHRHYTGNGDTYTPGNGNTGVAGGHNHSVNGIGSSVNGFVFVGGPSVGSASVSTNWVEDHSHSWGAWSTNARYIGNENVYRSSTDGASAYDHTHSIIRNGGDQPHNNMPPYIVKYCWERTA